MKAKQTASHVAFFKDITRKDVARAGGKGASLGEMTNAGIPVPPGFVVLASAFDRFLEETDLNVEVAAALKKVNHKDMESVEVASEKLRQLITEAKMPADIGVEIAAAHKKLKSPLVAVRSSATAEDGSVASWAGELETYLNVKQPGVLKAVQRCWSSLFTPRAIFYRFEKKLHKTPVSVAVVVQAMVQSEVSGIAFTVHPVTEDRDQMVIEAAFGLGEAIVGGMVTPDTYVVSKKRLAVMDVNVSEQQFALVKSPRGNVKKNLTAKAGGKQKLTGVQITELAKACAGIEKHYGKPQDIEWAYAKKKFYITQSRPITTLKK